MKLWNHSLAVGVVVAGMFGASAGAQAPRKTPVELGSINFPTSASPAAQAPFLTGVEGALQLRIRHRRRRLPRGAESRTRLRARLLGRGDELQPSALGAAGSAGGAQGDGAARADRRRPRRQGAGRQGARADRVDRDPVRRRRQAGARHRLRRRAEDDARQVSRRRRDRLLLRAGAARHRTARRLEHPQRDAGRRARAGRSSSATRSIPAPRTTSSTPSTIPITPSSA